MRFPLSLTRSMTAYLLRKKLAGEKIFPLVLMLEPLHACNLSCAGCGRIREYADTMHRRLSVEQCLAAVAECGAPIVSVCGGEPLIYPEIEVLVESLVRQRKHVYLCTNGLLLEKKLARLSAQQPAVHQRAPRRHGGHARPAGGARGRVRRGRPRHPRRQGGRLPGLHQHDRLPRHRHARNRRAVRLSERVGRGRVHDLAGLRLRGGAPSPIRKAPRGSS